MHAKPILTLSLLALSSALLAGDRPGEPRFSRSRWITERRERARFDGGALPASAEAFAGLSLAPARPATPVRPGPPNVRISEDILPGDLSAAQPETEAEPFFAQSPVDPNTLLAGYQEDRFSDGGARALTAAISTDRGATWAETLLPGLTRASGGAWQRASDPWVAYGPDGRAYYVSIAFNETEPDNGVFLSASDDGGHTWRPPATVHQIDNGDFDDKEAVAVDAAADSPYRGRIYVGWDTVTNDGRQILRASTSDDGATFSPVRDVYDAGANLGCLPVVGPGGTAYLVWVSLRRANSPLLVSRSIDGGSSWSTPTTIATQRSRGVPHLRTGEGLPAAAVDPHSGRLYVVWTDERFTPGTDQVVLSSSSDDGSTWTAPVRVSDGPNNAPAFTPAVAVSAQGRVGVAYSTLRNDPSRSYLVDEYLTTTNSRGAFQHARRMSTRSFDARFAAIADGFFLGDYQGLVAGPTQFRALWVGTAADSLLHPGAKQPDAWTTAAPINP